MSSSLALTLLSCVGLFGPAVGAPDEIVRADLAFGAGRYTEASAAYREGLNNEPDAPLLHHRLSLAALLGGEAATSERHALVHARLDPGSQTAELVALAAHLEAGASRSGTSPADAERALKDGRLRTAVDLCIAAAPAARSDADRGRIALTLGRALLKLGRADEAVAALESAVGLGTDAGPARVELLITLGDALARAGHAAQARLLWRWGRAFALMSDAHHPAAIRAAARLETDE